jgi:hypothetical protein
MSRWKDKNVGFLSRKGTKNKTPVIDERDGTRAGYHVEHWDDRKDAVAQPGSVDLSLKVNGDE